MTGVLRGNQANVRSRGGALTPRDRCPYKKKKFGSRDRHRRGKCEVQGEDSRGQAKEKFLE